MNAKHEQTIGVIEQPHAGARPDLDVLVHARTVGNWAPKVHPISDTVANGCDMSFYAADRYHVGFRGCPTSLDLPAASRTSRHRPSTCARLDRANIWR